MTSPLSEQLTNRLRAVLRQADHPTGAAGTSAEWRTRRDHWLDTLDPRDAPEFTEAEIRSLIDFLAESGPSRASRITPGEWTAIVDGLTPELLFSAR
jgi:hypothetical protein